MQTASGRARNELRIALVEDEPVQRALVQTMLEAAGFDVQVFPSTVEFRRRRGVAELDLVLLDWELPGESGIELLRSLRSSGEHELPVIFLTAHDDERKVVEALQLGADDYVVKPPKAAELIARVNAVIRRAGARRPTESLECEPFLFDLAARQVTLSGESVRLTPREFDLALHFFQRIDRIVSRDALLIQVWNTSPSVSTRSVDTFVSRLRRRLGLNGESGWKIEGIYQHGYRLVKAAQPSA